MIINYDKIISSKEELTKIKRNNPYEVVGGLIHTLCNYNEEETFYEMLQFLMGDFQEISPP